MKGQVIMPPRKKTPEDVPDEEQNVQTESASAEYEPVSRHNEDILSLSDQERGFTPDAGEDVKWNYLAGALRRHLILTGIVSGVEMPESASPIFVIDYEGIRILIPSHEMFVDDWPENEKPPLRFKLRFHRILGATVDFMLAGVDLNNHAAVASRRKALLKLQDRYYKTGRVKEGILVACRVIGVGGNRVAVEALGVDTEISGSEASWQWFADIRDLYSTGDIVVARVKSVEQNTDTGQYSVLLSIKAASDNPEPKAAEKLRPNSSYFGVVTGVTNSMIFIRLQTGVNVKTPAYAMKEPPHKLDTVCFQVKQINPETGMVLGIVTRVIKKNKLR